MPRFTIDAATAPSELLLRRVLGVPLVLWPLRQLRHFGPMDSVAVMTSEPAIIGLVTPHGAFPIPPSPATRAEPGLMIDPLQPFFTGATVRAAMGAGSKRLTEHQRSPLESLRADDPLMLEMIEALARGLAPDHEAIAGIGRLRFPLGLDIRAVVCDVDGTLTDGGIGYADEPRAFRTFSTRDGLGTHLLQAKGIKVAWLSATSSGESIHHRAAQLRVMHVDAGEGPKGERFLALCREMGVEPSQAAYIGDDANDLPAMRLAGLSASPSDAHASVRAAVDLVLETPGGAGAFRELADLLL